MPPPSGPSWTLQLLSCFLLAANASTFNIQADSALVIKGEAGSKFGFEVAFWTQQMENKLVIGAPDDLEGKGRVFIYKQEGSLVKRLRNITFIPRFGDPESVDMKYGVGFGTKIAAGVTDSGPLLICAPRTTFVYKRGTAESRVPLGECLLIHVNDFKGEHVSPKSAFEELSDAIQYCGFSAVFGKNDSAVFLGCPSIMKENQSYMLEYHLHQREWAKKNMTEACERCTQGGWGLADGTWLSKGKRGLVAACGNFGKIVRLDEAMNLEMRLQERATSRLGEMAGSSLTACDVNGDGRDEVVVAAPFGRVPDTLGGYKEVGRVTVLGFKNYNLTLHGQSAFGRFGSSVACLGDINNDSFSDLGVGASEHPGGGAVFVFLGSSKGLVRFPSQILHAPPNVTGFGFSLAGGRDIDGNGYPDVLVGAPLSDSAVTFKAAPVPKLRVETFRFEPPVVDLRQKDCDVFGERKNCFRLLLEVRDEGRPRDNGFKLRVKIDLDSGKRRKRIFFNDTRSPVADMFLEVWPGTQMHEFGVYAEDLAKEKDAIPGPVAKVNISLAPLSPVSKGGITPVIEMPITNNASLSLQCGNDTSNCVAVTDISLSADVGEINFTVGEEYVHVEFNITVKGDIAYYPYINVMETLGIKVQMGMSYTTPISLDCYTGHRCSFTTTRIRPGNEMMMLRFRQDVQQLLNFMNQTSSEPLSITCEMAVQCVNDKNASNDFLTFKMFPQLRPALSLVGESDVESIIIKEADGKAEAREEKISFINGNSTVTHTYTLRNVGLFSLQEIAINCSSKITGIQDTNPAQDFLSFDDPTVVLGENSYQVFDLPAEKKMEIILKFQSKKYNLQHGMNLTSTCQAEIISPSGASVASDVSDLHQTVTLVTNVILIVRESNAGPAAWVIVLAVLGACLLLALQVLVLYKLGFFKRKLPPGPPQGNPEPKPGTESEVQEIS
ncbi:integrin alpha-5-like [Penaeus chinensis]|uniref:integrin alpha-5-like n=1 Tax=Penaeus chinensis TaxID=139456 RepID=UPI001FB71190|nr:integrin alpha-5-like [Penaeus chinensis]